MTGIYGELDKLAPPVRQSVAELDETDRKLIAWLRTDSRQPVKRLAALLGISRSTVNNRIRRLMDIGVIAGFTVALRARSDPGNVTAIAMIEVSGRSAESVAERLRGLPDVRAIYTTNGRWDLVAEFEAACSPSSTPSCGRCGTSSASSPPRRACCSRWERAGLGSLRAVRRAPPGRPHNF